MFRFQLFRSKVYPPTQASLFAVPNPEEALRHAIESKPSSQLRRGFDWHIGNVEYIDTHAVYFALGRTTKSIVELFDEDTGDFVEQEFETSPYTHAFFDFERQVCAIAAKARLAPTVPGIARQLEKLLNLSDEAMQTQFRFEIAAISDPEDFLQQLRDAYQITRFAVEFSCPNPWDVEKDFHRPMQALLREAQGERGKASLKGENLNPGTLEELTRSVASSGNDAEATLRRGRTSRPIRRRLRGNPVTVGQDKCSTPDERLSLVQRIRSAYERVRARLS